MYAPDAVTDSTSPFVLHLGDCLEVLKRLPSNSVDSLVTDPPAGISFMGKDWDSDKGGGKEWTNWLSDVMREVCRVMKPGAHGLVWALPRISHRTAMAIEWAGLDVRDVVTHLFGSGFPKSHDISKAIDKQAGHWRGRAGAVTIESQPSKGKEYERNDKGEPITATATAWRGWGTALKPASEFWFLIRKPLEENCSIAENVVKHGTGAINIEASRIGSEERFNPPTHKDATAAMGSFAMCDGEGSSVAGRFPANLILSHNHDCELVTRGGRRGGRRGGNPTAGFQDVYVGGEVKNGVQRMGFEGEEPDKYSCTPDCPVAMLDGQSGQIPGQIGAQQAGKMQFVSGSEQPFKQKLIVGIKDFGGASRFFYVAKPGKHEKNFGCDEIPVGQSVGGGGGGTKVKAYGAVKPPQSNFHPTVKSFKLMRYLVTLITPPGGIVLDCFMGSGTTGTVAVACGFRFCGIERDSRYLEIARSRILSVKLAPEPMPTPHPDNPNDL